MFKKNMEGKSIFSSKKLPNPEGLLTQYPDTPHCQPEVDKFVQIDDLNKMRESQIGRMDLLVGSQHLTKYFEKRWGDEGLSILKKLRAESAEAQKRFYEWEDRNAEMCRQFHL